MIITVVSNYVPVVAEDHTYQTVWLSVIPTHTSVNLLTQYNVQILYQLYNIQWNYNFNLECVCVYAHTHALKGQFACIVYMGEAI